MQVMSADFGLRENSDDILSVQIKQGHNDIQTQEGFLLT